MIDKVLFVFQKWYGDLKQQWGETQFNYFPEALSTTGFAKQMILFTIDELGKQMGRGNMEEMLLQICASERPALVVFAPSGWIWMDPSRNIMNTIVNTLGIKVLMIRTDADGVEGHRFNRSWFPFVSSIAFQDVSVSSLGYSQNLKASQAFGLANHNYFYDRGVKQDIDISFVGSIGNWPRRAEYIQFSREHGVDVTTGGGQSSEGFLPYEEYARTISRSKISLNFCLHTGEVFPCMKGRVFEILQCGSCMFEDAGSETMKFLEPDKDFVMYEGKKDLVDKARYYLTHDEERQRIANSGHRKATQLYNPRNFWAYLFSKLGFSLPKNVINDQWYQEVSAKLDAIKEGK